MKKCEYCGMPVPSLCNGIETLEPDPFAEEIFGDSTLVWQCDGQRHQSAMEI